MLEIWGRVNSINVMKVVWACAELETRHVLHAPPRGTPEAIVARTQNPNGRYPVINDNGFILWESHAIVRYLCYKYGLGSLYPMDVRARGHAEQWMEWQQTTFAPPLALLSHLLKRDGRPNTDTVSRAIGELERLLTILDKQLGEAEFVLGTNLTMADIPVGIAVDRWMRLPIAPRIGTNVSRWYKTLEQRSAFKTAVSAA